MVHDNGNCKNLLLLNNHLIKNNQLHHVEKLNAKELYSFSIFFKNTKPTSQKYFQDYFSGVQLVWSDIYSLPRIVTIDSELKYFQYKILHNVLYLNERRFISLVKQTQNYVLFATLRMKRLFIFLQIVPKLKFKAFFIDSTECHVWFFRCRSLVSNHILLIFKHFIYILRDSNILLF